MSADVAAARTTPLRAPCAAASTFGRITICSVSREAHAASGIADVEVAAVLVNFATALIADTAAFVSSALVPSSSSPTEVSFDTDRSRMSTSALASPKADATAASAASSPPSFARSTRALREHTALTSVSSIRTRARDSHNRNSEARPSQADSSALFRRARRS